MTRMLITGISATAPGQKSKTGNDLNIGKLYSLAELSAPYKTGGIEKGSSGVEYTCDVDLVRKLEGNNFPFLADVELKPVMKFGTQEWVVASVLAVPGAK